MATRKDIKEKNDSVKSHSESSPPRTVHEYFKLLHQSDAGIYKERREKVRTQLDQMQKQRFIGGAEGRKRAMHRTTVDMVALDIRSMYFSFDRFASLLKARDLRMAFDWWDEEWRLAWLNFQVQEVKTKLWIVAPAEEVSVLSKFVRMLASLSWYPLLCFQAMMAIEMKLLRLVLSLAIPTLRR